MSLISSSVGIWQLGKCWLHMPYNVINNRTDDLHSHQQYDDFITRKYFPPFWGVDSPHQRLFLGAYVLSFLSARINRTLLVANRNVKYLYMTVISQCFFVFFLVVLNSYQSITGTDCLGFRYKDNYITVRGIKLCIDLDFTYDISYLSFMGKLQDVCCEYIWGISYYEMTAQYRCSA